MDHNAEEQWLQRYVFHVVISRIWYMIKTNNVAHIRSMTANWGDTRSGPLKTMRSYSSCTSFMRHECIPYDRSPFHDEERLLEESNVLQRVSFYSDHVGEFSRLNRSDTRIPPEQVGRIDSGRLKDLQRCHTRFGVRAKHCEGRLSTSLSGNGVILVRTGGDRNSEFKSAGKSFPASLCESLHAFLPLCLFFRGYVWVQ